MIICIDIGNTSTKVAAVIDDAVTATRSRATRGLRAEHIAGTIAALVAAAGREPVAVGVSSVVPSVTAAAVAPEGLPRIVVTDATPLPIRLSVSEPETLGADRICAAVGAVDDTHRDAIVVDIGTAITVDRVRDLEFIGGVIMPGPRTMLDSLARETGRLPRLDLETLPTLFPGDAHPTANAIALGVGLAAAGGIRAAVERLSGDSRGVPVVVTGGDAGHLSPHLPGAWRPDADLTLRGLARITRYALAH